MALASVLKTGDHLNRGYFNKIFFQNHKQTNDHDYFFIN